jgi:site-specific recombinase XerD
MKKPDSYIFTSENDHTKMLTRETITRKVNKVMKDVSNKLPDKFNITSHSFRIVYITELWKNTSDIEFVRQVIGHQKLDTTSLYINELSDDDRRKRISKI